MGRNNNPKGKGKGQKKRIRLLLEKVKIEGDEFVVPSEALAKELDGTTLKTNCPVTFYKEFKPICKKETDDQGKAICKFRFPLTDAGKKVTVSVQINGAADEDPQPVELPIPNKGRKIELHAGEVREVNGEFVVDLEARVSEPNESPAKNVDVKFIDFHNKPISTLGVFNGKASIDCHFPLKHSEKTLKFRTRITNSVDEDSELVIVPKAKYTNISYWKLMWKYLKEEEGYNFPGFNPLKYKRGSWELIKKNWKTENKTKMFSKVALMYLVAIVTLLTIQWAGLRWTAVPLAIAIVFGIAILPGKFTLGLGSVYASVFLVISMIVPELTSGALSSAAYLFLIMGPPTYIYEELSYREKQGENNIYPWLMLKFCWIIGGFYVGWSIITLVFGHDAYLDSIRNFLENDAISGYAKDVMLEQAHKTPKLKHTFAYVLEGKEFLMSLVMAVSWLFASAIIFVPTAFGEFKQYLESKMSGKKQEGLSAGHLGMYFILDQLIDVVIKAKAKRI